MDEILENAGFPELVTVFNENDITLEDLVNVSPELLKELIPRIGLRIKFSKFLNENYSKLTTNSETDGSELLMDLMVVDDSINLSDTTSVSSNQSTEIPEYHREVAVIGIENFYKNIEFPEFDLSTLLQTQPRGTSIVNYYSNNEILDHTHRSRLVSIIINHLFSFILKHTLNHADYNIITSKIITLFPNENPATYYVPTIKKKDSFTKKTISARGRLVDKVKNLTFQNGHVKKRKTSSAPEHPQKLLKFDENIENAVHFLKNNSEPWSEILEKWNLSYNFRRNSNSRTVSDFIEEWPILLDSRADQLINLDFDYLHPSRALNLFNNWEGFYNKAYKLKKDTIKENSIVHDSTTLLIDQSLSNDYKNILKFRILCHLIAPKGRKLVEGKHWKYSIVECIESIFINAMIIQHVTRAMITSVRQRLKGCLQASTNQQGNHIVKISLGSPPHNMDEKRIADYFVIAGLPANPELVDEDSLPDVTHLKPTYNQLPITDIAVIFPTLGEQVPEDFEIIEHTPTGLSANLNHGSIRCVDCFLCFRRGKDKPPLVDIGVMYEGKERLMPDAEVVKTSVGDHVANVNNSAAQTFITYRRGLETMACNTLVVTDVCVVISSKGESPPHAFCCIYKNLNKGLVGSDVFLCYKKSVNRTKMLTYKPTILFKYPGDDLEPYQCPDTVSLFCLPMGATLELWPANADESPPVFSTFVLTIADAKLKVYGAALTFYERFAAGRLTDSQRTVLGYEATGEYDLYVNKSICLLSRWPFSDTFQKWLNFLYNIVKCGSPTPVPMEHYLAQLFEEVPFPSPRTLLQLTDHDATYLGFTQPEALPLPRSAAGFKQLLLNLGAENSLLMVLMALTERKILIHSLRPDLITAVVEALASLLFPFRWQCAYVPLCPLILFEVLHCPLPFLVGVDSRIFKLYNPPNDVSCVDLDTNTITVAETYRELLNIRILPKKATKVLKATLEDLYTQMNEKKMPASSDVFQRKMEEQRQELQIQDAFLRFMAMTLKGYRAHLLPITKAPTRGATDVQRLFNLREFLRTRDKSHQTFFALLVETQMFTRFVEERSFVADGDQTMAFFDECTEVAEGGGGGRLLVGDLVGGASDKTVVILPPEGGGNEEGYTYETFMVNPDLLKSINNQNKHKLSLIQQSIIPGSPMARRTKHEIQSAQKLAKKSIKYPEQWARCLNGTCYTLYFMVLPSFLALNHGREWAVLQQYYEQLVKATRQRLPCDEVCYRVMMQLCGEYSRPLLTVNLRLEMKQSGIELNALTYGLYNRCVLEANWPKPSTRMLWNKVRNVILGTAHFKFGAKRNGGALNHLNSPLELDSNNTTNTNPDGTTDYEVEDDLLTMTVNTNTTQFPNNTSADFANNTSADFASNSATQFAVSNKVTASSTSVSSLDSNSATGELIGANSAVGLLEKIRTSVVASIVKFGGGAGSSGRGSVASVQEVDEQDGGDGKQLLGKGDGEKDDGDLVHEDGDSDSKPLNGNSTIYPGILESPTENLRLLSRQESAGDANIMDKLQQNSLRQCARSLQFNCDIPEDSSAKNSPNKVSPRTLVTRNDPLGALDESCISSTITVKQHAATLPAQSSLANVGAGGEDPVLFRTVQRSSTFDNTSPMKRIHRSETVPAATVASSLSNIGSSIKSSFSRYSPVRFSIKKPDIKASQLLESTMNNLGSLKSAANTVAKKFDEIKEAMSTSNNSTPVKTSSTDKLTEHSGLDHHGDGDYSTDGSSDVGGEGSRYRKISATDYNGSYTGSCMNLRDFEELPDNIYSVPEDSGNSRTCGSSTSTQNDVNIYISSSTKCNKCATILYDEEIMSNWNADDSNLNTVCQNCKQSTVPLLTVTILDGDSSKTKSPPFSIPYLNPLVLRKELENILAQEGDLSPSKYTFVDDHPIIYWNLVWAFERIHVTTHLPNLYLREDVVSASEESTTNDVKTTNDGDKSVSRDTSLAGEDEDKLEKDEGNVEDVGRSEEEGEIDGEDSEEKDENLGVMLPVENGTDPLTQETVIEVRPTNVTIRCLWDNPGLHNDGPLLYLIWKHKDPAQSSLYTEQKNTIRLMQSIIQSVRNNELFDPLKLLILERQRLWQHTNNDVVTSNSATSLDSQQQPLSGGSFTAKSLYRDILFLACIEFGRRNIDLNAFDREYFAAFAKLPERSRRLCQPQDSPIALGALYCRQFFRPLMLHY